MASRMFKKVGKQQKTLGKYNVIKTLGSGNFKVKMVQDPVSGQNYAAKVCKYSLRKSELEKESSLLSDLNKLEIPNMIKFIEFIDKTESLSQKSYQLDCTSSSTPPEYSFKAAIILELASNETIFDIIYYNGKLGEKLARTYFRKLLETVGALHSKGYVHRDLKPENILLDDQFQIKLIDFGFAREFTEFNKDKMITRLGTESYMGPEMYTAKTYSGQKLDVFSCGVLLFLFVFGKPPFFKPSSNDSFYKHIIQGKPEKFWAIYEEKLNDGAEFDQELKLLITQLLNPKPEERPEVSDILEHEWIKGEIYDNDELMEVMKPLRQLVNEENQKSKK